MNDDLWRRRTSHVRETVLKPLGLQMLLAYADDPVDVGAVRYLTDFDVYSIYALAIVPLQGDVTLAFGMHHSAYLVRVMDVAKADYLKGTYAPGALCRDLLPRGHMGGPCRIGVVGGERMIHRIHADLRKHLGDAIFLDVDAEFWHAVAASDDREAAEHLRRSAKIASKSVDAAARLVGAPFDPMQTAADVGLTARRLGADVLNREMVQIFLAVGSPLADRLVLPQHCEAKGTDAIAIEVSAAYRGVRSICTRTFLARSADDRELHAGLNAVKTRHASVCDLMQPEAKIEDILRKAQSIGGWSASECSLRVLDITHGSGMRGHSRSALGQGVLRTGMALAVEMRQPAGRLGMLHFGDTVLINSNGPEVLTR